MTSNSMFCRGCQCRYELEFQNHYCPNGVDISLMIACQCCGKDFRSEQGHTCVIASTPGEILGTSDDKVNHPSHYTSHPSGVECVQITEHMNFNLGNAVKYIWRVGLKGEAPLTDLRKAQWYIEREIGRLENETSG